MGSDIMQVGLRKLLDLPDEPKARIFAIKGAHGDESSKHVSRGNPLAGNKAGSNRDKSRPAALTQG